MFKTVAIATIATFTNALRATVQEDGVELITAETSMAFNTSDIFDLFDKNEDDQLKKGEWVKAYKFIMQMNGQKMKGKQAKAEAKDFLDNLIDENQDGQVCRNEFRTFICTYLPAVSDVIHECYADADLDDI